MTKIFLIRVSLKVINVKITQLDDQVQILACSELTVCALGILLYYLYEVLWFSALQ